MLFKIINNRDWDNQPHPIARQLPYADVDIRQCSDPTDIPIYQGNKKQAYEDWYGEGKNHRLINGQIARDFDKLGWFVEFNTLEELHSFLKTLPHFDITRSYNNPEYLSITIDPYE